MTKSGSALRRLPEKKALLSLLQFALRVGTDLEKVDGQGVVFGAVILKLDSLAVAATSALIDGRLETFDDVQGVLHFRTTLLLHLPFHHAGRAMVLFSGTEQGLVEPIADEFVLIETRALELLARGLGIADATGMGHGLPFGRVMPLGGARGLF